MLVHVASFGCRKHTRPRNGSAGCVGGQVLRDGQMSSPTTHRETSPRVATARKGTKISGIHPTKKPQHLTHLSIALYGCTGMGNEARMQYSVRTEVRAWQRVCRYGSHGLCFNMQSRYTLRQLCKFPPLFLWPVILQRSLQENIRCKTPHLLGEFSSKFIAWAQC